MDKGMKKLTPEKYAELRSAEYLKWRRWAVQQIAHHVITEGFRSLEGVVEMVVQGYRTWEQNYPSSAS